MQTHRYAVGDTVEFVPGPGDGNVPRGSYVVQRPMPAEAREREYRVRSTHDGHERVLPESKLRALPRGPFG